MNKINNKKFLRVLIVMLILVICVLAFVVSNNGSNSKENVTETKDEVNENEFGDEEISVDDDSGKSNGFDVREDWYININDYFIYDIPEEFEKKFDYEYELNYVYDNTDSLGEWEWNKCEFSLNKINVYSDIDYMKSVVNYYKLLTDAKLYKTKINNITWYYTKLYKDTYIYATSYNGDIFNYIYRVNSNIKNDNCSKYHNQIINSIKFK